MKTKTSKYFVSFTEWMRQTDQAVFKKCGMFADDLPDYCYKDAYFDGYSPARAASAAIKAAKE